LPPLRRGGWRWADSFPVPPGVHQPHQRQSTNQIRTFLPVALRGHGRSAGRMARSNASRRAGGRQPGANGRRVKCLTGRRAAPNTETRPWGDSLQPARRPACAAVPPAPASRGSRTTSSRSTAGSARPDAIGREDSGQGWKKQQADGCQAASRGRRRAGRRRPAVANQGGTAGCSMPRWIEIRPDRFGQSGRWAIARAPSARASGVARRSRRQGGPLGQLSNSWLTSSAGSAPDLRRGRTPPGRPPGLQRPSNRLASVM